jgi:hypothetical protein
LSKAEFSATAGGRGKWDNQGIVSFAKDIASKYSNKVVGLPLETFNDRAGKPIEGFYNRYYLGSGRIKYINYYCRKRLIEAFETLGIKAAVRTAKNQILIQLGEKMVKDTEDIEEPNEDTDVEDDE